MNEHARKRKLDAIAHSGSKSVPTHTPSSTQHILPPYGRFSLGRASGTVNEDAWEARSLSLGVGRDGSAAGTVHVQFFGVHDGHGAQGDLVSAHVSLHLHQHFSEHMRQQLLAAGAAGAAGGDAAVGDIGASLHAAIPAALVHAFEQTDKDLMHQPVPQPSSSCGGGSSSAAAPAQLPASGADAVPGRMLSSSNAGSTATVAVITPSTIYLAWAGDSRAVLLGNGSTLASTLEHKAEREDEQDRITAAGGRVFFNSGLRVMGMLATTRAIGDHDLRPYGVVPTPDVLVLPRSGREEFLVLASDGLWDVVSNEEVYDYARKTLQKVQEKHAGQPWSKGTCCACQAAGIAARALTHYARNRKHSKDDITVLVVNLHTPCACPKPVGAHYCCNSSVLSRAPGQHLQRSSSADGALPSGAAGLCEVQQPQQQPGMQPVCAAEGGSSAGCSNPGKQQQQAAQDAAQPTSRQSLQQQPQQQQQQQQQRPISGAAAGSSGGSSRPRAAPLPGGIVIQPSVCAARSGGGRQRRLGLASAFASSSACKAALRDAELPAAQAVSDLVMSSPFAGMLGSIVEPLAGMPAPAAALAAASAAAAAAAASAAGASGLAMSSGSAPASAGGGSRSLSGDGDAFGPGLGSGCQAGRQVGSAPAEVMPESMQHLGFALGSGWSCGGLLDGTGSLSCPLGSAELPVAV